MKVRIHLIETSQEILHTADNTYQKGAFFCVKVGTAVYKYPIANIWRVVEDYDHTVSANKPERPGMVSAPL